MSTEITQQAVQSFLDRKCFSVSNTRVEVDELSTSLFLFDNKIAILTVAGTILVSLGGHPFTRTTQERLNGIPGINVSKSKRQVLLNGLKWNGEFIAVKINQ